MQSESDSELELHAEDVQIKEEKDYVVCPNCKSKHDPDTIYCLSCGYPLYTLERDHPEQSKLEETDDARDVASEPEVEPSSDPEKKTDVLLQIEEAVEVQDEKTPQEAEEEVEPEPGETLKLIESVRARARDLVSRYSPFKMGSRTHEIESDRSIDERYSMPTEKIEDSTIEPDIEESAELVPGYEQDPVFKGMMRNIVKSVFMNFWLVDMLQEGNVEEEQFNRLIEEYADRSTLFMRCRDEMLERALNLNPIEKALKEAKVELAELEMKKAIGAVSEDEYHAKAPGFKWDISRYEAEISRRKEEIDFLEDLTSVISTEEIAQVKEMAEKCQSAMNSLEESCKLSPETVAKVKGSLEESSAYLENFGLVINSTQAPTKKEA